MSEKEEKEENPRFPLFPVFLTHTMNLTSEGPYCTPEVQGPMQRLLQSVS
jgi:hypothetical protein